MLIEIIATNLTEAKQAEEYGASRIELIHAFDLGGLSPQLEISRAVCAEVAIPVNIMIRPHGNSFHYAKTDIQMILRELEFLRDHTQAKAVVFGALNTENKIDTELLKLIIENKGHLGLTFHRAIDVAQNTLVAYSTLLDYPEIDLVLSSGGYNTAPEGKAVIQQMVELSRNGAHCQVLAGSGITPANARNLIDFTGVKQIHLGTGVREGKVLSKAKFAELMQNIYT